MDAKNPSDVVVDADGVYSDSGFRLPLPKREDLDEVGQRYYDHLMQRAVDPRRGATGAGAGVRGPAGIKLYAPRLAEVSHDINWYLRFESSLDGRTRELAILVAAREMDCDFEWAWHEGPGIREGLDARVIDVVRRRGDLAGLAAKDAIVIRLGREAMTDHRVSRGTFDEALALFGPKALIELVSLMGNYQSASLLLLTFGMTLAPGMSSSLTPREPPRD